MALSLLRQRSRPMTIFYRTSELDQASSHHVHRKTLWSRLGRRALLIFAGVIVLVRLYGDAPSPDLHVPSYQTAIAQRGVSALRAETHDPHTSATVDPSLRGVCYIHVGKAGGASIVIGLKSLLSSSAFDSVVQIHGYAHHRTNNDRDYGPGDGPWGRKLGFYPRDAAGVRTLRNYGGPLSSDTIKGVPSCARCGRVLLWVRDPISRLISAWNFLDHYKSATQAAQETGVRIRPDDDGVDLNDLVEHMSDVEGMDGGLEGLYSVLVKVQHATHDIEFYLGNNGWYATTWSKKSGTCRPMLSKLPVWFVGRTEHMSEDWGSFLDKTFGGEGNSGLRKKKKSFDLPRTHGTKQQGRKLSQKSVAFLRQFYAADYSCIAYMVERGWLERDYYDEITMVDKVYQY